MHSFAINIECILWRVQAADAIWKSFPALRQHLLSFPTGCTGPLVRPQTTSAGHAYGHTVIGGHRQILSLVAYFSYTSIHVTQ